MQRRVLRFPIHSDNSVGAAEVYGPDSLGKLGFPDGIAFDEAGNLWVAFPVANALGYIDTQGRLEIYVQDLQGTRINRPANICFGGPGRRTAYIGSLSGNGVPYFEVPHPGMRLVHQK
ncbi:MAG TPA: SMP-30/gluconolactonase/LRE family protein, partial [Smithellaceae bacterium]|nr:SMP-30/gluconolactonase/LRE family protein [Smithellaceae bacterium]